MPHRTDPPITRSHHSIVGGHFSDHWVQLPVRQLTVSRGVQFPTMMPDAPSNYQRGQVIACQRTTDPDCGIEVEWIRVRSSRFVALRCGSAHYRSTARRSTLLLVAPRQDNKASGTRRSLQRGDPCLLGASACPRAQYPASNSSFILCIRLLLFATTNYSYACCWSHSAQPLGLVSVHLISTNM